jgi:CubicO group peptidase (beta-lactamase class C family)
VRGASEDAQFRVASLTKPFVARLALIVTEAGLLDLGAPAHEGAPTLRQLLAHEGGVHPDLSGMERFGESPGALGAAVREVLERRRRFRPGRAWEYANSGYWIVADAAARAAGEEFELVFERHVLRPLGLVETDWNGERLVLGHDERLRPVEPVTYPRSRRPSGGLVSTIRDILSFGVASVERRRRHEDDPLRATLFGARSGLGWQVDPAGQVAFHDGDYGGFCARLAIAPNHGTVVAIIANASTARRSIRRASDALLRDLSIPIASTTRRNLIALAAYAALASARLSNL